VTRTHRCPCAVTTCEDCCRDYPCPTVRAIEEALSYIAAVTEVVVREEIARDIEATRGEHLRWYGNQLLSLAARIARGDTLQRLREEEQTP